MKYLLHFKHFRLEKIFLMALLGFFLSGKLFAQSPQITVKQGANTVGSYDFGNTNVGTNSGNVTFTLENTSGASLSLNSFQISSTDAAMFTTTSWANAMVTAGSNATFGINFNPSSAGFKTAFVTIGSSNPIPNSFSNKTTANGLGNNTVRGVYVNGGTIYAATQSGLSFSTDGGNSFANKTTVNGLGNNNILGGVYVNGGIIYAATGGGGLSFSTDGGNTFTNRTTTNGLGNNTVRSVYVNGGTIYVATDGGLSFSTDGGNNFTNRTTGNGLGNNTVLAVYVNGGTIYAATQSGLSFSTDGGNTFTNKTTTNGLGSNVVYGISVVGTNVYAATAWGLSISTDSGNTFTNKTTTNGLGNDTAWGVYISSTTIYAATYGGLSISTDGGNTFTNKTIINGLGDNLAWGVYVNGSNVYAATGNGLSIGSLNDPYTFSVSGTGITPISDIFATVNGSVVNQYGYKNLGSVPSNSNLSAFVTISNTGTTPLSLGSIQLNGSPAFTSSAVSTQTVAAGANASFSINFNTVNSGYYTAFITIANNVSGKNPYYFTLFATVDAPIINLKEGVNNIANNSGQIQFISTNVGTTAQKPNIRIENLGNTNLNFTGFQISGANANLFSTVFTSTNVVNAGSSITFDLKYTPNSIGSHTAFVTIYSNDPTKNPYTFAVSGYGFISTIIPTINQGTFISTCGNSVSLNTSDVLPNYEWNYSVDNINFSSVGTNNAMLTATLSGYYRLNNFVSGTNNFSSVTQIVFNSATVPVINQGAFISTCNNSVSLNTSTVLPNYKWEYSANNTVFNTVGTNSNTLNATNTGFYRLNNFTSCGNIFSSVTQISFQSAVMPILNQPSFVSACQGKSVSLGSNTVLPNYQWQVSTDNINFSSVNINAQFISVSTTGYYRLNNFTSCTNNFSSVTQIVFTSVSLPTINQGTFISACGNSIILTTNNSSNWYYSSNNIDFTTVAFNTSSFTANNSGFYKISVNNSCGLTFSTSSRLVFSPLLSIALNHGNLLFITGGQVNLSANFVLNPNYSLAWERKTTPNENFIPVNTANTNYTATQFGFYRFKAVNVCGAIFSTVVEVRDSRFNDAPTFNLSEYWFTVPNNKGRVSKLNFITSINDGDSDLTQNVNFTVVSTGYSSSNWGQTSNLFAEQPQITPDGKLTFTPLPNAEGWFYLDIYAKDDGLGNFPNVNTSPVKRVYGYLLAKNLAYIDINKNGVYDVGDFPAANRQIRMQQSAWWTGSGMYDWLNYTDNEGYYYLYGYQQQNGAFGSYITQPNVNDFPIGSNFLPAQRSGTFTRNGYVGGNDFAIQIPNALDVAVDIWDWWWMRARPGFQTYYALSYKNDGTQTQNGKVTFKFDPILEYRGNYTYSYFWNTTPQSNTFLSANTLTIEYQDLKPGETRFMWTWFRVPPDVNLLGKYLHGSATITPDDNNKSNNVAVSSRLITGAYDPNDKKVSPEGNIPPKFVADREYLEYKVRFQNTGSDTAFNVRVEDQLSTNLDLSSLQMLGASHAYRLKIDSVGKAIWEFENILLPDNKTDDPGSNGYFSYRVKPKNTLVLNDEIKSKAYIYFDYNPAIITNETLTKVWADLVPPTVANYKSEINAQNVVADADLFLIFDESVKKVDGKKIFIKENGILKQSIDVADSRIKVKGKNIAIDADNFGLEKSITVEIESGAFQDLAGNDYVGTSNEWKFVTQKKNQQPSFIKGTDFVVFENAGLQSLAWAKQISAGENETYQRTKFILQVSNPSIFSQQPEISADGTLSFTPSKVGVSTIKVKLQDDGGSAEGGLDSSAEQSFSITILPKNNATNSNNDPTSSGISAIPVLSKIPMNINGLDIPILAQGSQFISLTTVCLKVNESNWKIVLPENMQAFIYSGNSVFLQNNVLHPLRIGESLLNIAQIEQGKMLSSNYLRICVEGAKNTISLLENPDLMYGSDFTAIKTNSSSAQNPTITLISGNAIVENNKIKPTGAGKVVLRLTVSGNEYFEAVNSEMTFEISKGKRTLNLPNPKEQTFGNADLELAADLNGDKLIYFSESNLIDILGNKIKIKGAGQAKIKAKLSATENCLESNQDLILNINKANQKIDFAKIDHQKVGNSNIVLSANSSANLPISFQILEGQNIVDLQGNILKIVGFGKVQILAKQAGNENYLSSQIEQSFEIANDAKISIKQAILTNKSEEIAIEFVTAGIFGQSNEFTVFLSNEKGVFGEFVRQITGNFNNGKISLTIPANILKSSNYQLQIWASSPVSSSDIFKIENILSPKPAIPNIILKGLTLCANVEAPHYQWFANGKLLTGENKACMTISLAHGGRTEANQEIIYTVLAINEQGRESEISAPFSINSNLIHAVTATESDLEQNPIRVYPNPVKDRLVLDLSGKFLRKIEISIFNMLGQKVLEKSFANSEKEEVLDLNHFPAGTYLLEILSEKGKHRQQIVKE